jgi:hypothetical protein
MGKNDLPKGKGWEKSKFQATFGLILKLRVLVNINVIVLIDDVGLGGALCVWLTKQRREWLSGRWLDARWDVEELERRKEEILEKDLLKFRMTM